MSKRRSRAARRRLLKLLAALLILTAIAVFFLMTFRLKTVLVKGNLHNTPDSVTELLLERPIAENTVLAKLFNTNRKIEDPGFIDSINVEILDRDKIRVYVTERTFVGCIPAGAFWWYFDASGKVLAQASDRTPGENVPSVEGLDIRNDPQLGSYLSVLNTKVFSMLAMLRARIDLNPDVMPDKVVFDEGGAMSLYYGDVLVLLGTGEKLELRLKELSGVIDELKSGAYKGTLHLETYDGSQTGLIFDAA